MTSGEPDFTKRTKSKIDHWWIKGVELQDPTFIECLPCSIENDAIAYDEVNDRFKVDIEAITVGTLQVDVTDKWTRQLGLVDLSRVLGAALSHANPVITRLTNGTAFIDPKDIRALTATDIITAYGNLDALQQRATTKELIVQIQHQGVEKDPTQIRALTNSDVITVEQATAANLKGTVTQLEKDRTITDVSHDGTAVDLSHTFAAAGSWEAHTVTADKKVRVLFISLELSADVDLGYRFAVGGTIYYLRTTAGPYVSNLVFCTNMGAVDEDLFIYASAACVIKGYAMIEEV